MNTNVTRTWSLLSEKHHENTPGHGLLGDSVEQELHDAIEQERLIDEELEDLLSTEGRDVLDGVTRGLQEKTVERIECALKGIRELCGTTKETAIMAEKVSRKIRDVDTKQSRVREVLQRIDVIRDRSRAVEGLKRALDEDDLGSAVGCISQFLDLIEDMPDKMDLQDEELNAQLSSVNKYKAICETKVREKATQAIAGGDHDRVTLYCQMYGPLKLEKEGVAMLVEYASGLIHTRAQEDYDALVDGFSLTGTKVTYVDALSNVLKDVAQSIDQYVDIMRDSFGPEHALEGVHALHGQSDVRGTRVLKRYIEEMGLSKICAQFSNRTDMSLKKDDRVDARKIEPILMELLVMCTRGEEYIQFVLRAMADAASPNTLSPSIETSIRGGLFGSCMREILSYYISLEEYYIEESVAKAIEIDEAVTGSLTSSMVDDTFYVLLSSGKRALSIGRVPSAVSILNQINSVIATLYRSSLVKKLQGCPSRLASCAPCNPDEAHDSVADVYALAINDVDLSALYVQKLKSQLEQVAHVAFASSAHDEDRIRLVLADLGKTSTDIRRLADQASEQLTTSLMLRLRPTLDTFMGANYELSDDMEINDDWSISMVQVFGQTFSWLENILAPKIYRSVIELAVDKIVTRMEACVAQKQFSQLGGLQLEKDVRALAIGLTDVTKSSMRDKFSRLQQIATVLGVETASEAADLIGDSLLSLTNLDIRQALSQRLDLTQAAILAVKL